MNAIAQRDNWRRRAMDYRLMVQVFRGCIITQTLPAQGSECHKKVQELLNEGEARSETPYAAGEGK